MLGFFSGVRDLSRSLDLSRSPFLSLSFLGGMGTGLDGNTGTGGGGGWDDRFLEPSSSLSKAGEEAVGREGRSASDRRGSELPPPSTPCVEFLSLPAFADIEGVFRRVLIQLVLLGFPMAGGTAVDGEDGTTSPKSEMLISKGVFGGISELS